MLRQRSPNLPATATMALLPGRQTIRHRRFHAAGAGGRQHGDGVARAVDVFQVFQDLAE